MIVSEAMDEINDSLRGLDDVTPTEGSDEWNYWLRIMVRKISELYRANLDLSDIYEVRDVGQIIASAAPEFDLDDEFISASDSVYCVDSDGKRTDFTLIQPKEKDPLKRNVFIAGKNPKRLYFTNAIVTGEQIIGATLYVPGYYLPEALSDASDDIPVSDPYWLTTATAAEIAFNDLVYEDKALDLNAKANALYTQIVSLNRGNTYGNTRKVPTRVTRISDTRRR